MAREQSRGRLVYRREMLQLTRDDDRLFSTHPSMASTTDRSLMPLFSQMLGGQRRKRNTLDGGHDGVRLYHRQESPRARVSDAAVLKTGLSDGDS